VTVEEQERYLLLRGDGAELRLSGNLHLRRAVRRLQEEAVTLPELWRELGIGSLLREEVRRKLEQRHCLSFLKTNITPSPYGNEPPMPSRIIRRCRVLNSFVPLIHIRVPCMLLCRVALCALMEKILATSSSYLVVLPQCLAPCGGRLTRNRRYFLLP